jgi:uncharacterized protein YegJ (DUF2314 family)
MQAQPVIKRGLLMQLIALFIFVLICGLLSLPVLTIGGDACGTYKMTFFLLVFFRLAWQIYRRTFRFRDYFVYFAITIAFCFWADHELEHIMFTRHQKSFLVKVVFDEGEQREHIWVADLGLAGDKLRGVIANEPNLPSLKFMEKVEFEPRYISDWMYIEDGYLVGGYTTRVIRDRMTPEERAAHDAQAPYKFR